MVDHGRNPEKAGAGRGVHKLLVWGTAAVMLLACAAPPEARAQARIFSINGVVRAEGGGRLEGVLVELRTQGWQVMDRVFTRSQGDFEFRGLSNGVYMITINRDGYDAVREQVEIFNTSRQIQLFLHETATNRPQIDPQASTISARELALPQGVRKAWEKGLSELGKGNAQKSLGHFERVVKEAPGFYEAHHELGVAYSLLQQFGDAEAEFRKAIEMSEQKYASPYFGLAGLATEQKKYAAAATLAQEGLAIDNGWKGHYELARAQYGMNQLEDAEKSAEEVVKMRPDYSQVYLVLANIHMKRGELDELLNVLNRFLELEPKGPMSEQVKQSRDELKRELAKQEKTAQKKGP